MPAPELKKIFKEHVLHIVFFLISCFFSGITSWAVTGTYEVPASIIVGCSVFFALEMITISRLISDYHAKEEVLREQKQKMVEDIKTIKKNLESITPFASSMVEGHISFETVVSKHPSFPEKLVKMSERLTNIWRDFLGILADSSDGDFFIEQIEDDFEDLAQRIHNQRKNKLLIVKDYHLRKIDQLIEFIRRVTKKTWRFLWKIEKGERLFDVPEWTDFFIEFVRLAESEENKEFQIYTVFVIDERDRNRAVIKALIKFYKDRTNFHASICNWETYKSRASNIALLKDCDDFAVFGETLLFRALRYLPSIEAEYSRNDREVRDYIKLFDHLTKGYTHSEEEIELILSDEEKLVIGKIISSRDLVEFDNEEAIKMQSDPENE